MRRIRAVALLGAVISIAALPALSQTPSKDTATPPVIKSRPEPTWPTSIKKKVEFSIILHAVFRANGKVTDISRYRIEPEKQEGLPPEDIDSLTERAIDAASKITFIPAVKNGHSVSMWMELEYQFKLEDDNSSSSKPKTKQQ